MTIANLETIIDMQSWCRTWPLSGSRRIRAKTKLHKKPREACKSSWNPRGILKSFTLTIPWNSVQLVKISPGTIARLHPHRSETNGIAEGAVRSSSRLCVSRKCSQVFMVRSFVEPSENSKGAVLKHCPAGLDADLAEYLAGRQLPVLNSTDNSLSDGAECGDSASGEDEFNEGFEHRPWTNFGPMYNGVGMDSVNKHPYFRKRMCRFGSRCWRPHCWFHYGNGDRMKQIVTWPTIGPKRSKDFLHVLPPQKLSSSKH